ncbi:HNH endonuclease (plasmid) [Kitasatospora sp. NBC_01246]|uniref:HNH endonuclease n=1 Tax=Kitasatospora sp. NBC_01246 TaxID=2903570 RepID=UPI002E36E9F0|nr:HNH endonuclease [Kitasatospora sp. NBC_01246]
MSSSGAERALAYVAERSVLVPHGCRFWSAALTSKGYAKAVITESGRERTVRVHRWLVEQVAGPDPLPPELKVAHGCNESLCVQIDHLAAVSQRANLQQMARENRAAGRAHVGVADTRGSLGRAQAIQAALREGLDLPALAAAMLAGEARPLVREVLERGYDPAAYLAAVAASDPTRGQLPLF